MSHEIQSDDGLIYTGLKPWHGIGKEVDPSISAHEAMMQAGLGWDVQHVPLYVQSGVWNFDKIPSVVGLKRSDTGKILGIATDKYRSLQNSEAFEIFQEVLSTGMAHMEVAGSLKGGRVVWALARIKSDDLAVDSKDLIRPYVLLSLGHDGKTGIRAGFTPNRVVCNNTLTLAHNNAESKLVRVVHRGNVKDNVQALIDAMDLSVQEFRATVEDYRKMLNTPINQADLREYVRVTLGLVEKEDNKRATNIVDKVVGLASAGRGNGYAAGTVWGGFNGVTEYLTHVAGRSNDSRLSSLWFGNNKVVLKRAHEEAMRLVA